MDIRQMLNGTAAGQIALNLDKQDEAGSDGKITKNIWERFWSSHGGDAYKGRNENVGDDGVSVETAIQLIMTRIANAARKTGENVNALGQKWFNDIEGHEYLKYGEETSGASQSSGSTSAQGTSSSGETKQTGGSEKSTGQKTTGSGKYSTESIKVNVKPKYMSAESKKIIAGQKEGVKLRESLRQGKTQGLNKYNISMAMDNSINFGANSLKQAKIVFELLKARIENVLFDVSEKYNQAILKIKDPGYTWEKIVSRCTKQGKFDYKELNTILHGLVAIVRNGERNIVTNNDAEKISFNKDVSKIQSHLDKANELLVDIANNPSKARKRVHSTEHTTTHVAILQDGRKIRVEYDNKGEIEEIGISFDTKNDTNADTFHDDEVTYKKNYGIDVLLGWENGEPLIHNIEKYNTWNELVRIAESIFGKSS